MAQIPLFAFSHWSVSELTRYLKDILESDEMLQDIWIHGEVSNLARPSSGHLYFTLKDNASALKCVMWRSSVQRLSSLPVDGQAVEVHGSIGVYETGGQYQLYIDQIRLAGEGLLYQEFNRLKTRLEAEGLFDPSRKRPIPRYPKQVGIVTSPTGAALQDILNTLRRRYPAVDVILAPSPVQGDEAPLALISSIEKLNHIVHPDVIILARGGGSIEDLWAFNDERLAYAIGASEAPIICGVGHETDFTIADFVCDLRAPTPTAAAELAVPNRIDLQASLSDTCDTLIRAIREITSIDNLHIERLQNRLIQRSPAYVIRAHKQQIDDLMGRMDRTIVHKIEIRKLEFSGIHQHLVSINPMTILGRGYAVVTHADGGLIRTVAQVQPGNRIEIRVQDGKFPATIQNEPSRG